MGMDIANGPKAIYIEKLPTLIMQFVAVLVYHPRLRRAFN
jgi:hypothetical protein